MQGATPGSRRPRRSPPRAPNRMPFLPQLSKLDVGSPGQLANRTESNVRRRSTKRLIQINASTEPNYSPDPSRGAEGTDLELAAMPWVRQFALRADNMSNAKIFIGGRLTLELLTV